MPGDNKEVILTLAYPMPTEQGLKFALREGKITVGAGVVTECISYDPKVEIEGVRKAGGPKGGAGGGKGGAAAAPPKKK